MDGMPQRNRISTLQPWYAEFIHNIPLESEQRADRVVEACVADRVSLTSWATECECWCPVVLFEIS